jgi:hypothetical protein
VRYATVVFLYFAAVLPAFAQISPPGMDDTRAVVWGAVGFTQNLGPKWQTMVYLGASRESNPNNYSFLTKPAISVIDFSQLYRFNEHWSLSAAVSYREQNRYSDDPPYGSKDPGIRDEMRYYMRLYYRHKINRIQFTYSFRPEFRTYHPSAILYEYRFRLKAQAAIPLNKTASNQLVIGNEILTVAEPRFADYHYTEDRATVYFRHTFARPSLIADVGLMGQVLAGEGLITHVAFDFIFVDPFGKHLSKK